MFWRPRYSAKAKPVTEIASEVRAGLDNLADAVRTLAGVMAARAATCHSRDYPDQRDMASVIYADAKHEFAELLIRRDPERQRELEDWITKLCKGPGQ